MRWQGRSRRKYSGGRYHPRRKKRKFEAGRPAAETTIGETREKIINTMGGNKKIRMFKSNFANVADPKSGTMRKTKIIAVKSNPANRFFVRRNIITKSAVIKTELGDAVVTSRLGQDGIVNARLVELNKRKKKMRIDKSKKNK